ncbi:beta strand repeat-containing protein, partial [Nevskia soli]|uniref:beta strand repeat-containing protein n=1 Tax=Nevskia soli TaxID=418856 RepID=UPI0005649998
MTQYAPRLVRLPIPAAIARSFAVASLLLPGLALAGPTGGVVVGGQATIGNPSPTSTVIHQGSNSAIINWQQFNIGGNEYVQFIQPSSSSVVLNRVIGGSPSEIFGSLSANGRVFLINPNGVLFAPGAQLDVGGLVASTMNIKDADFLSGHYVFAGGSTPGSSVVNGGTIKTGDGGFVVLAGDYVKNTGIIQAKLGQVVLASGSATTLELGNSGLVSFAVDKATLAQKAGVDNAGQIIADGGRVVMTAKTAHDLVGSAVNNSGLVRAQGIASHNGEIELTASGGDIADSGTLDASSATGSGGTVAIAGDRNIAIEPTAQILASGSTGGKIRVVADGTLTTAAGSSIEAHGSSGKGGAAELSGHGKLVVRGNVNLGSGGTLLIDPTDLTIADGTGASSSATVFEKFVENQLKNGTDMQLVATNSITLANLSDGTLDGVNPVGYGGSLLLGIGTIDPNNGYVEGNSGSILFANTANTISVYGGLRIDAGSGGGTVKVGNLIAGNIQVQGLGGITAGTITAERGGINLTSGVGNLSFGALSTKSGDVVVSSSAGTITGGDITTISGSISVEADAGGIKLGNLSSTYIGSYGGDASITVRSSAGIEVGSVTTDAEATGTFQSSSNGNVILFANDFSQPGGDLLINGPISTTAKGANGFNTATISLSNSAGSITALGALTTHDPGPGGNNDIDITAYGGNVITGALTATNSSINVSAQATNNQLLPASNGDITLGTLSGGGAPGNALTSVTVDAYGGLTVASDIAASSINLFAGHGDLKAGNINVSSGAFSVTDYGGNLTLGDVSATDYISLNDVGGDIKAGNLTALNGSISASTSSGSGNITLGALSGGSGNELSFVDVSAYGGVTIGGSDIVARGISLGAGNGNLSAGNITATRGGIILNDSGGSIAVGKLSASASSSDGSVSAVITAYAAGGISTGSITTSAFASGSFLDAYIQLEANSSRFSTQLGGELLVAGTISTSASNSGGNADSGISTDAGVTLYNGKGGITTGDIDTHASAFVGGLRGNIDLKAFSGNVGAGTLTVIDGGAISVSTNTSGDISVGQLSAPGGGLSFVTLSSAGGLTTNGTGIIANQISLSAANGDLTTGDLTNRVFGLSISDYGGTMTLGTVHSEDGGLALYDSNGGINTGNLFSADNIFITTVGTGGNVKTGTVNANSGTLGTLDIESSGGIDIGGPGHAATTAGVMTLNAGNGDVTTGDLTGTFSSVTVSSVNGNIVLGKVTADGPISITSVGTSNNINDTVVTNGNISTGDLTDTSGNGITVTSSGFGNISVGALSGSSDGSLGVVKLAAAGALKTTGPAITAGSITLSAGNGDLTAGDLTSTNSGSSINITDTNGKITVGTVTALGDIVIHDGGGGIQTQDLRANKGAASILVT